MSERFSDLRFAVRKFSVGHSTEMREILAAAALVALVLAAFSPRSFAQDLTAREIVNRALARAQAQREAGADVRFESVVEVTTEFLDSSGAVERTERETFRQYPLEGVIFEELIAREGMPLEGDDARRERERREEFADGVRERRARGEDPIEGDENEVEFNQEFVDRYQFSLVGEETVSGDPSWVIELVPRDGDLPVRRRIDHALNNSTATIWVSQEDYGLPRVEFEMSKSVRFWGGILGTLRHTVGRLEFTRMEDGIWLPTLVDIRFDLRILFRNIRRRVLRHWHSYSDERVAE